MARNNSVLDALNAFSSTYGLTRQFMQDADLAKVNGAKPEETAQFTPEQSAQLEQAAGQGLQLSAGDTPGSYAVSNPNSPDPAATQAVQDIAPQGKTYSYLGQQQATPFTPSQLKSIKNEARANVVGDYDPAAGLKLSAAAGDAADKATARDKAAKLQKGLDEFDTSYGAANDALAQGDPSKMQAWAKSVFGASKIGSDPDVPGGVTYDPTNNKLTLLLQGPDGKAQTVQTDPQRAAAFVRASMVKNGVANPVMAVNGAYDGLMEQMKTQMDIAKGQSTINKDTAYSKYLGDQTAVANRRVDVTAQGQGLNLVGRAYTANARSQPKPAKELTEKDVIAQNDGLGVRLDSIKNGIDPDTGKSIPQGQVSSRYTAEVQAGRDNIQLRGDAAGLRNAVTSGALSPEAAVAGMKARGASDARIAQVFQAAGVPLPGTKAPPAAPKTALPVVSAPAPAPKTALTPKAADPLQTSVNRYGLDQTASFFGVTRRAGETDPALYQRVQMAASNMNGGLSMAPDSADPRFRKMQQQQLRPR